MSTRDLTHLWLRITAEREKRVRKLILRKPEEEVGLVLAGVRRPLQDPAAACLVVFVARVVASRDQVGADLPRGQSSWSNFKWLLQSEQGIGVRPARYSLTNGLTTSFSKRSC